MGLDKEEVGWSNFEGHCRGPIGGECGRTIRQKLPLVDTRHEATERVRCRVCGTPNTLTRKKI